MKYDEVMGKAARSGLPAPEAPVILPDTRHDGKIDGVLCIAPARGTGRSPGYPGPPRARDGTRPVRDRVTRNDTGPRGVASRRTGSRQRREVRRRAVRCAGAGRGVGLRLSGANPRARRHADRSALGIVLPCDDNSGCSAWYSSNSESADCQSTCRQAVLAKDRTHATTPSTQARWQDRRGVLHRAGARREVGLRLSGTTPRTRWYMDSARPHATTRCAK